MTDRATIIAEILARHFSPQHTVLEIGAGKGHVARALKEAAQLDIKLVDVVDYNETELKLELYDGVRLPFADQSFDYSLLVFVLHHTPEPLVVLQEALRVSRCGVLVVENHVQGWLRRQVTRAIDSIPHWQYGVPICYHTHSIGEWHDLFEQLPAHVELITQFNLGSFWANAVMRVERLETGTRCE